MKFGRIHWFVPGELNEEQRELYDRMVGGPIDKDPIGPGSSTDSEGRLYGGHNPRLLNPKLGRAIEDLVLALRFDLSLPARSYEICCLETAREERSNVEWDGHLKRARKIGVAEADLEAIRTGGDAPTLSDEEQLVRRVAQEILRDHGLSDELFDEAERVLGTKSIFEIVSIIGQYQHTGLALRIWKTPPRPGSELPFDSE